MNIAIKAQLQINSFLLFIFKTELKYINQGRLIVFN